MPIVHVDLLEGRSRELKEQLIAELTETVVRVLEVPTASVRVLLNEVDPAHWGVGGVSKQSTSDREGSE